MDNSTFTDEYGNVYATPYIPKKILGFQGIDPSSMGPELAIKEWWDDYKNFMQNKDSEGDEASSDETIPISHNKLSGLDGGDAGGYYHLTETEYEALAEFLENLGKDKYKYQLTEDDYSKLMKMLTALRDDIDKQGLAFLTDEEYDKLNKVFGVMASGGDDVYPVFLSEKGSQQLSSLLRVLYPEEDSTEPLFPSSASNIDGGEVKP